MTDYASYSTYSSSGASLWHVTYVYDAFNQLVGRKEYDDTNTLVKSEHFIYDNGQIVLKLADDGTVKQRYLWAPAVDMLLAQEDGSTNDILWALGDNLNTIRDWVDDSGEVVAHRSYDPFGVAQAAFSSGTVDSSFAWTGKFRDNLTELQNNIERWYAPRLGKWMSRDPSGILAGDMNFYRYVVNSPANGIDPTGLVEWNNLPTTVIDTNQRDPKLGHKKDGSLIRAATYPALKVEVPIECKENGKWGLKKEIGIKIKFYVYIVATLRDEERQMFLYTEDDHIDDMMAWERDVTPTIRKMEMDANRGIYGTENEAREKLERWFYGNVRQSLIDAFEASGRYWDDSGRHTGVRKPWPSTGHGRPAH